MEKAKDLVAFSLAVDESCDASDTAVSLRLWSGLKAARNGGISGIKMKLRLNKLEA